MPQWNKCFEYIPHTYILVSIQAPTVERNCLFLSLSPCQLESVFEDGTAACLEEGSKHLFFLFQLRILFAAVLVIRALLFGIYLAAPPFLQILPFT